MIDRKYRFNILQPNVFLKFRYILKYNTMGSNLRERRGREGREGRRKREGDSDRAWVGRQKERVMGARREGKEERERGGERKKERGKERKEERENERRRERWSWRGEREGGKMKDIET